MPTTPSHLRELLAAGSARYASLKPGGIILEASAPPVAMLRVQVASVADARTLYRGGRPLCRSLDGVRSVQDRARQCAGCRERPQCTPQLRIDFHHGRGIWRMLLAYTNARNLVLYQAQLRRRGLAIEQVTTRLRVADRGRWGELSFLAVVDST